MSRSTKPNSTNSSTALLSPPIAKKKKHTNRIRATPNPNLLTNQNFNPKNKQYLTKPSHNDDKKETRTTMESRMIEDLLEAEAKLSLQHRKDDSAPKGPLKTNFTSTTMETIEEAGDHNSDTPKIHKDRSLSSTVERPRPNWPSNHHRNIANSQPGLTNDVAERHNEKR